MPTGDRVHLTHENKKTSKNRILRPRSDNFGLMGIPGPLNTVLPNGSSAQDYSRLQCQPTQHLPSSSGFGGITTQKKIILSVYPPVGSERGVRNLGTRQTNTQPLRQQREIVAQLGGNLRMRSRLDDVLECTNGLGAGTRRCIRQEYFAQLVPVLGGAETRQDYGTSQLSEREMECRCLGNKHTVASHSCDGTRRRVYAVS
jgi:hypothetical protein